MIKPELRLIREKRTYLYTTVLFTVIILLVYAGFGLHPFSSKTLLTSDMRSQYIDFLAYFKKMKVSWYSPDLGMGNDRLSFFAYYLSSPVNLLVFAFKNISDAVSAIFIVKIFFSAITCNLWLRNSVLINKSDFAEFFMPILSVAYAFCGFNMMYSMSIIWLDTVYLFPLLILSIEKTLLGNRKIMPVMVALIIITGFYTGIMAIYFSLLYCIALYMIFGDKVDFCKMIYNYFVGVSMSAVILMTTLIRLSSNKMDENNFLYKAASLLNISVSDVFGTILNVWILAILAVALITVLRMRKRNRFNCRLNKILFVAFGVGILFVNIILLIKGFRENSICDLKYFLPFTYEKDSPQLYTCILVYVGIISGVSLLRKGRTYAVLLLLVLLSLMPVFSVYTDTLLHAGQKPISFPYRYSFIISFWLIAVCAYVISAYGCRYEAVNRIGIRAVTAIMSCIFAFEIFFNALGAFKYNEIHWFGYTEYDDMTCFTDKTSDAISKINDSGFYRVEKHFNRNINDPMQLNYKGINHYSSMYNHHMIDFLARVGCITTIYYGTHIGHTPLTDLLFGIKYTLGSENTEFLKKCTISEYDNYTYYNTLYRKMYSNGYVDLYENPYGGNFAFYADAGVLETDLYGLWGESFEVINEIYNSIMGKEINPYKKQNIYSDDINNFQIDCEASGRMFIRTAPGVECENISVNGISAGSGYYEMFGYVRPNMYCADVIEGERITLHLESARVINPNEISVFVEQYDAYDEIAEYISSNQVDYSFVSEDEIMFDVSGDGKPVLTNIPYDENWRVVSGTNVTVGKAFDNFLTLEIPQGERCTAVIKYRPSGVGRCAVISTLGVLAYVLYAYRGMRHKGKKVAKVEE